ncbi:hypothetical protein WJX72_008204 [[Myrmecia] bisecta]|uniref:Ribosomal RNA-processing protein 40 n=1 Tax=[Myrmecia] bisecta TaxID=41462 RepID=A0AAW1PAP2_9CHLO
MSASHTSAVGKVVLPGDNLLSLPDQGVIRVGAGLRQSEGYLQSIKPGVLKQTKSGKYWIEGRQKRYIPAVDDVVVGVVSDRQGDNFAVDINGPFPAALPVLAFEGATRRNRPNLQEGDLVYARVTTAYRDADPELSCVDASGKSAGFGPLKDGYLFTCTNALCRQLLSSPPPAVLLALGKSLQFEIVVGMNGRVWVNSPNCATTVLVSNAVLNSEFLSQAQAELLVKKLLAQVQQTQG